MSGIKAYNVNCIKLDQLVITGKVNSKLWSRANVLTDFCSPWKDEKPLKTEFRALRDDTHLFFSFTVYDSEVYIDTADNTFRSINNSDRIELFFRTDEKLNPYYCLEIDPTPRIMDFKAYPNKKFDFNFNWPKNDIEIKSFIGENHFSVEIAISILSMKKFKLIKDNKIETGIFRAKYKKQKDLNFEPTWISWVNPNTDTPNFHTASSFGVLHLLDK